MVFFSRVLCQCIHVRKTAVLVLIEERSRVTLLVRKDHSNWTTRLISTSYLCTLHVASLLAVKEKQKLTGRSAEN